MAKEDDKKIIKYVVIALISISIVGGMVYKIVNPTPYKHPLHRK